MPCCEVCGSQHTLNNNLARHKEEVHREVEKGIDSCKQCDYQGTKIILKMPVLPEKCTYLDFLLEN